MLQMRLHPDSSYEEASDEGDNACFDSGLSEATRLAT